jgi:hypothetical protein
VVIFFARISWLTSYTVKPFSLRAFRWRVEFFSLAFLFLLANACSVLGGCCSECWMLFRMQIFVVFFCYVFIRAIIGIMIVAKMYLYSIGFVQKPSYLQLSSSSCQFQHHMIMIHVHIIVTIGDSVTLDGNYPVRYCYPTTFPRFQYRICKLLLCRKFRYISSTIRNYIDEPLMITF